MDSSNELDSEEGDLRNNWSTFLVPSEPTPQETWRSVSDFTLLSPYRVAMEGQGDQPLWYLALTSCNGELLRATAQLFISLNAQYHLATAEAAAKLADLRDRQAQQLTALLEAGNDTGDMVVASDVTERVVLRHQMEIETMQQQLSSRATRLEAELRKALFAFLKTSAPDAVAAQRGCPSLEESVSNVAHFARAAVPVRTVELPNLWRHEGAGQRRSGAALRPIVLNVSPTAALPECLGCLYAPERDNAPAVTSHLLRLARRTHAVLLLIGSQSEAEALLAVPAAELLLRPPPTREQSTRAVCAPPAEAFGAPRGEFAPLPHAPHLRWMRSTRHFGANLILLWTPPREVGRGLPSSEDGARWSQKTPLVHSPRPPHVGAAPAMPAVVEDALGLAASWNADMFSVALLDSATALVSPTRATLAQSLSMEVLRQVQRGVAALAHDTDGSVPVPSWGVLEGTHGARWEEDRAVPSPTTAGSPSLPFNTALAVRAFLPLRITSDNVEGRAVSAGAKGTMEEGKRQTQHTASVSAMRENASFSSDRGVSRSREGSPSQLLQQMPFEKMIAYSFGESAVVY